MLLKKVFDYCLIMTTIVIDYDDRKANPLFIPSFPYLVVKEN